MEERHTQLAGLETCVIRHAGAPKEALTIVFLHGHGMQTADLTPFAHSLAIPQAVFVFPQAPLPVAAGGFAWWSIGEEGRAARAAHGPRDLAEYAPAGRIEARARIRAVIAELVGESGDRPLLLAGFSQGGMLACDTLLMERVPIAGLAMMSASRIAMHDWREQRAALRGMRAFVSHGRADADLAFGAGERLADFLRSSSAAVTWVPFDGPHEVPLIVWRQFRHFTYETINSTPVRAASPSLHGPH